MNFDQVADFFEPLSNAFCLVPSCIVHHQMDFCAFVVAQELFDEPEEGPGVESLHETEMPSRMLTNPYCSDDLYALAAGKAPDGSSFSSSGPCSMK